MNELELLKKNLDSWIKQINKHYSEIPKLIEKLNQIESNTDFNYELIKELKGEIETLKLGQIIIMKIIGNHLDKQIIKKNVE